MNKKNEFSSLLANLNMAKVQEAHDIQAKIVIREEFKSLIPPLTAEELQQLEANILAEGVRDPVVLWEDGSELVIIDGHNRYSICTKHALPFQHKILPFASAEEVKKWMVTNQLGRRNLSPEQQSYLRGLRYLQEKSQGQRTDLTSGQNVKKSEGETTAARLGAEFNVSERTIIRDAEFAKGIDKLEEEKPGLRREILSGKSDLRKSDIQEVGKSKIPAAQMLHVESQEKTKTRTLNPFTPERVAEIAFSFFTSNTGPIDEVASQLSLTKPYKPLDFLIKWSQQKHEQP
ncbi:MAG TPA: hypothetical protein VGD65_03930 [Chryseosolibacter sp.]